MSDFYTQHLGLDGSDTGGGGSSAPVVLYDDTTAIEDSIVIGTLTSTIGTNNSTLIIGGITGFDDGEFAVQVDDFIRVDNEIMRVVLNGTTAVSSGSQAVGITRQNNFDTTAAGHTAGVDIRLDRWGRGRTTYTGSAQPGTLYSTYGDLGLGPTEAQSWWYPLGRALTSADADKTLRIYSRGVDINAGPVASVSQVPVRALLQLGDYTHEILTLDGAIPISGVAGHDEFQTDAADREGEARTFEFFDGGSGANYTGLIARRVIAETDRYGPIHFAALSSAIQATSDVITVGTAAPASVVIGSYIVMGREYLQVTSIMSSRTILGVTRGALGTTATTHAQNASVRTAGPLVGRVGTWMLGIYRFRQAGRWETHVTIRQQTRIELV